MEHLHLILLPHIKAHRRAIVQIKTRVFHLIPVLSILIFPEPSFPFPIGNTLGQLLVDLLSRNQDTPLLLPKSFLIHFVTSLNPR